jgi:hypothetical protein
MDLPVLIQQSKDACDALETSIQKNGKSMDGLLELLNGTGSKLDALAQQGDETIQTVDQSLTHLDSTLDSLMKALGDQMLSVSDRVTSASRAIEQSIESMQKASANLSQQCATTSDENRTHLERQSEEHVSLQGTLGGLLGNLLDGSRATIDHAHKTQDGIDSNHQQVLNAGKTLAAGFLSFGQAILQHGNEVGHQVNSSSTQTQQQIDQLRTDLDKQLKDATDKVKAALEKASRDAHNHGDQVELFLGNLIQALETIQGAVDHGFRPPIQMIGNVEDKIQPIINLVGTLKDLGLV